VTNGASRRGQFLFVGALAGVVLVVVGCSDDPSASPSTNTDAATVETAPPETTAPRDNTSVATT